jgi:hypothetical protein
MYIAAVSAREVNACAIVVVVANRQAGSAKTIKNLDMIIMISPLAETESPELGKAGDESFCCRLTLNEPITMRFNEGSLCVHSMRLDRQEVFCAFREIPWKIISDFFDRAERNV